MKGSSTDKIIETVNMCPTEALTWKWNNEGKNKNVGSDQLNHIRFRRPELMVNDQQEMKESPVSAKVMIDGPVVIKGNFTLKYNGNSKGINNSIVSICRCGESDHMPFCDGNTVKQAL